MSNLYLLIAFFIFTANSFFGQNDSALVERKEGLYLDYLPFRENRPITKPQIITNIDTAQLDFFTKVVSQKEILIRTPSGTEEKIFSKDLWGYFQNSILYIYYDNAFYKVPVLGAISYFIGTQEVTYYSGVGIGYPYGMAGVPVKTRELKEFLLDYYTGKVYPFSIEQLEELLKKDAEIYNAFTQLSRKQKKKKYSYYIRLFNEKHPIHE